MPQLQDRIILLNGTPDSNPPAGISYVFVDGNGNLKQLDSAGNTTEYIPKSGADFADMPSVGGDAIVASGSNTDGEWVKYADGTMICWNKYIELNTYNSNVAGNLLYETWALPENFINTDYIASGQFTPKVGVEDNATGIVYDQSDNNAHPLTSVFSYQKNTGSVRFGTYSSKFISGDSIKIFGKAVGRWK